MGDRDIRPERDRSARSRALARMAERDAVTALRLARRVVLLEAVVRWQSDEIAALRAIAGGVWAPEVGE